MLMSNSYHDTGHLGKTASRLYESKAKAQETKVLDYFRANPGQMFTPEQIGLELMPDSPRTSWGRCLSNLTRDGFLEKSDKWVMGSYGRPIRYWKLAAPTVTTDWVGGRHGS